LSDYDQLIMARIVAEIPIMQRLALSMLHNRADADDLVQDCLARALSKRSGLNNPDQLRAWMSSILKNLFRARLRTQIRRMTALPIEDVADSLIASVPFEEKGSTQDLARAMRRLSVDHREILVLVNMEGRSYREAAGMLGVPVGTVMSRVARARQQLRDLLQDSDRTAK
jgi:RNA polymerase sigma-70 factor (ECF subfamily)